MVLGLVAGAGRRWNSCASGCSKALTWMHLPVSLHCHWRPGCSLCSAATLPCKGQTKRVGLPQHTLATHVEVPSNFTQSSIPEARPGLWITHYGFVLGVHRVSECALQGLPACACRALRQIWRQPPGCWRTRWCTSRLLYRPQRVWCGNCLITNVPAVYTVLKAGRATGKGHVLCCTANMIHMLLLTPQTIATELPPHIWVAGSDGRSGQRETHLTMHLFP